MVFDRAKLKRQIKRYLKHLTPQIRVYKAILFGSYAYGEPREWSDIDLAILSPDFSGQGKVKRLEFLYRVAWEAGADYIEPLGFTPEEFEAATNSSLTGEIRQRGIVVYETDGKTSL